MKPTLALLLTALLAASPALDADAKGKGHGKDKHHDKHDSRDHRDDDHNRDDDDDHDHYRDGRGGYHGAYINLGQPQLQELRQDFVPYYQQHCPPGQAKKGRCRPVGYVIGQPLPPGVVTWAVPQPVLVTLPPPPPQANYVMVDRNLLLISEGTKRVLDGLVLFSGVQ